MSDDQFCECTEATRHVYDYQHGELTADECARVKEHLEQCPPCRDLYTEEETIRRKLSACACEQAPMELRMRVTAFIASVRLRG